MSVASGRSSSRAGRGRVGARRVALKRAAGGGGVGSPRVQVSEMQRARLLSAAVVTIDELGYAGVSVAHITARARVSRRTFYDLFADREDCLIAVLDDVLRRIMAELVEANVEGLVWRERVRVGLWRVLCFFDREPVLARVCLVHSASGGPRVLEYRQGVLARLTVAIDEGRLQGVRAGRAPSLTAEGLAGAAVSILYARLLRDQRESLRGLLGQLMSIIVLPYLGPAVARAESALPAPAMPTTEPFTSDQSRAPIASDDDPLKDVPMRLTYRTARVLQAAAEYPGTSNRVIGEQADIYDQGQISKLLGRLERIGLLQNTGRGQAKGEPNAWRLTGLGQRVTQQLALNTDPQQDNDT